MNLHLTYKEYITHQHPFENDYEGKVITTLIESRANKKENKKVVLYIHGFSDYFFQYHMMRYINAEEINFFAVDLRKCGRSLLSHQHPNYCQSMREYFPDLNYAIEFITKQNSNTEIYMMGHSTGGLLVSYYAKFGLLRNRIKGIVLNSPFLDFNLPFYVKPFITTVAKSKSSKDAYACMESLPPIYGESLHRNYNGEWKYSLDLKPIKPFPAFYAWILAVQHAQSLIKEDPNLGDLPILLMRSDKSGNAYRQTDITNCSDVVLNVKDMTKIGCKLSDNVEEVIVEGGVHDLVLSSEAARNFALQKIVAFVKK
ncbi:alpha/beta hydrolase [Myroides albus]|uniref:Alpha/beta fold hydrolase n=1 Tax=Myroides albus TaxID=2562892 RepID=A0A6I3LM24_9FLAO|nr:alpha/beta hydrolase [Myroides albus]MTG98350.1 alpha/beta fold hydrolase [Myroides albus]UVD80344.1 alpha/beta hydrolase [Myroides albus]